MPIVKIFSSKNKGKKNNGALELTDSICTYYFSVLWNKNSACNLFQLAGQIPGGEMHQLISKMIADTDGEITVEIGKFVKGTKLNLFFGVQAITKIENLRIIISNATEKTSVRVLPKDDTDVKKIEKGEIYNDQILKYDLQ
ncbi:hypothetical protein [Flavobacterium sp. 22076]|uniref:hypothetical protein n=1 Tax=unclassified Flavobacterium TaxID=196869 RepID=UPI003F877CF0